MTKHSPLCQEKQIILQEKEGNVFWQASARVQRWQVEAFFYSSIYPAIKNNFEAKSILGIRMPVQDDT